MNIDNDEQLKYFWPHPYPQSHPPVQVTFTNGLPESDNDPIHKTFTMPYSVFRAAIAAQRQALRDEVEKAVRRSKPTAGKHHYIAKSLAWVHDRAVRQYTKNLRTAISTIFEGKK